MSDDRYDNIEYDEKWQSIEPIKALSAENEIKDEYEETHIGEKRAVSATEIIVRIQLIICLIAAIAFFVCKNYFTDYYSAFINWYDTNISNQIIVTEAENIFR